VLPFQHLHSHLAPALRQDTQQPSAVSSSGVLQTLQQPCFNRSSFTGTSACTETSKHLLRTPWPAPPLPRLYIRVSLHYTGSFFLLQLSLATTCPFDCRINSLTPKLNPSEQRSLPRFFTGDFKAAHSTGRPDALSNLSKPSGFFMYHQV
jgi:hypothetical protein